MKNVITVLCILLIAACGGGESQFDTALSPKRFILASPVSGDTETALHLYQALYGKAPSFTQLNAFKSQIAANGAGAWVNATAASLNNLSNTAFATLVLNNISITPTSLTATAVFGSSKQAYDGLLAGFVDYLNLVGVGNRGIVAAQLAKIISNLEADTQFGVYGSAALVLNRQIAANQTYSLNVASLIDAVIPTRVTTGVVAGGAPVANGSGYVLDASAANATAGKITFTTNSSGEYSVDLSGKSGPFLYHLNGVTSGGTPVDLYSIASSTQAAGRVNITPLTSLVLGYASGSSGALLESTCTTTWSSCAALLNSINQQVSTATTTIMNALPATLLSQFGLASSTFNPFTTSFTANHTGFDGFLDAITVTPAAATGASNFTVVLNSTGTLILTVPTTGIPATQSVATPVTTTPSAIAVTQSESLAKAFAQIETRISAFNALFANSVPLPSSILSFLDAGFMYDGANGTTFANGIVNSSLKDFYAPAGTKFIIGGLAPYSGAPYSGSSPGANVTFNGSNCVSSVWVYSGKNGFVTGMMELKNSGQDANCVGGTWSLAGNGRQYAAAYVAPMFFRIQTPTPSYRSGLGLATLSSQAATNNYAKITISGPGITTKGAPSATTGSVDIVPANQSLNAYNLINNSFYGSNSLNAYSGLIEGTNQLLDCTLMTIGQTTNGNWNVNASSNTPCLNTTAAKAGSDYIITVKDSGGSTLEKFSQRLAVAPTTVIPDSWYPTVTGITPAGKTIGSSGGTATLQWTLPSGAQAAQVLTNINDANGSTLRNVWMPVASSATAATLTIPALPSKAGLTGLPDAFTSYGMVSATINGMLMVSATAY